MKSRSFIIVLMFVYLALLMAGAWSVTRPGLPPSPPLPQSAAATSLPQALPRTITSIQDPLPRTGDQPLLVILADFPDKAGTLNGADWAEFFFGSQGFAAYYQEVSYNHLRYTSDLGDIVGSGGTLNEAITAYVRLPYDIIYYAHNMYGYDMSSFPQNDGGVVRDALAALDSVSFDFAPYADAGGSGKVENLVVIFAGFNYGYVTYHEDEGYDKSNTLEATAYKLSDSGLPGGYTSSGGQKFDNYTICPELYGGPGGGIAHIGICSHEHGHALGMFDLYDLSYQTSGTGYFDLMSYGAYGADAGVHPFHPSGFTKSFYGWSSPLVAPTGTYTITLQPAENGDHYIKLYPDGNTASTEYFILENRQALGFDQKWGDDGLCTGLLIWHVDQNIVQAYTLSNTVNSLPSAGGPIHQGVIVVEADGDNDLITPLPPGQSLNFGECSDTFAVGRSWSDNTTPSARLWDGSATNLYLRVLEALPDGSLVLSVRVGAPVYSQRSTLPLVSK